MDLSSRTFIAQMVFSIWLLLGCSMTDGTPSDIFCLRSIKDSLEDPHYQLSSWDFNNNTEGFICQFTGVECWHADENRVLNLKLSNMGLKGQFPRALQNCSSLTGLDLSINELSGTIPSDIPKLLTFVTFLNLSSNEFSGKIPLGLANCTYLNSLILDQNRLSGQIPPQLGQLSRLKTFTVTNNLLSGQVPSFRSAHITAKSYANNSGLCGGPLEPCDGKSTKNKTAVVAGAVILGAAVGGVTFAALGLGIATMLFFACLVSAKKKEEESQGNKWRSSLKSSYIARTASLRPPVGLRNALARPFTSPAVRPLPVWEPNPLRPPHPLRSTEARLHASRETYEGATSKVNSQAPCT